MKSAHKISKTHVKNNKSLILKNEGRPTCIGILLLTHQADKDQNGW